jgi:hypothetical protein
MEVEYEGEGGKEIKVWMGYRKGRKGVKDCDLNEIIFPKRPVLGMCYQVMTKWWDIQDSFFILSSCLSFMKLSVNTATEGHPKLCNF